MKLPLTGGCLCGALRYEISEAPSTTYTCHCTDCQHLTSSAFSFAITVPDGAFRLTKGEPRLVQKSRIAGVSSHDGFAASAAAGSPAARSRARDPEP